MSTPATEPLPGTERTSGAFIALNADGTIRTFFKPNNGEAYFRRQSTRSH